MNNRLNDGKVKSVSCTLEHDRQQEKRIQAGSALPVTPNVTLPLFLALLITIGNISNVSPGNRLFQGRRAVFLQGTNTNSISLYVHLPSLNSKVALGDEHFAIISCLPLLIEHRIFKTTSLRILPFHYKYFFHHIGFWGKLRDTHLLGDFSK